MIGRYELLNELQQLQNELIENGFKCWLDYGQLLSAKRSNKLLPWDNDIDFGVLIENVNKVKTIEKILEKYFGKVNSPIRHFIFSRFRKSGFIIDFFFHFPRGKWYHSPFGQGGLDMRSFFFDELEEIVLDGVKFKCPRHLDLYLKIRYGDTWETPIQASYSKVKKNPGNIYQEKEFSCLITGVFDLLHEGHIRLIKRASNVFDKITIGICNDETVESYKRTPHNNQDKRFDDIIKLKVTDSVIKDFPLICTEEVLDGYDFVVFGREESNDRFYPFEIKNHPIERTQNISTTKLLEEMNTSIYL